MAKDKLGNQDVTNTGYPGQGFVETMKRVYETIKGGDPQDLASEQSIAKQIKRRLESRERRALEPTRQKTPPQTSHRDHYNDQEDYN